MRNTNRRSGEEHDYRGRGWGYDDRGRTFGPTLRHDQIPASFGLEQAEAIFRAFFEEFNNHSVSAGGRRDSNSSESLSLRGGGFDVVGRASMGRSMSLFDDDPSSGGDPFFSAEWFHTSSF